MQIANKIIDNNNHFVIAEIGHNHGGNLDVCKEMFRVAKECGADAVKLQKRDNKTLYTKAFYNKPYENENSFGRTYGEHREALEFNLYEYLELSRYAKEIDIIFFATAFDISSADFLYSLNMPVYKIASADINNWPLIHHISKFKKPMIISTGGATIEDIDRVYKLITCTTDLNKRNELFAFLHCVATYPNHTNQLNLIFIKEMIKSYNILIGYSNHHPAVFTNYIAYAMGARIFEAHFTLSRASKGTDHAFSLEPRALETLCEDMQRIKQSIGTGDKQVMPEEEMAIQKMGKAIWPVRPIKKGEILTEENIALKTPALKGLAPYKLMEVYNKIAVTDISTATPIKEEDFL